MDFENGHLLSLNITATKRLTRCHA
jgi:hypothetical protein